MVQPLGPTPNRGDGRLEPYLRVQLARERGRELLHSLAERDERRRRLLARLLSLLLFPTAAHERLEHRSVVPLEAIEPGQRVADRELLGVARVHAGDVGVGDVVEHFLIEAPPHEPRDALLHRRIELIHQRLAEDRELGALGQEPGGEDLGGRHRKGNELVPLHDEPLPRRRRRGDDAALETEVREERGDFGRGCGQGVGAEVGEVAVVLLGADHAAEPVARLVEDDAYTSLLQSVGGGETSESSADDGYRCHADDNAASSAPSSSSPCAAEVKAASKAEGARYMPASSIAWKNAAYAERSLRLASA